MATSFTPMNHCHEQPVRVGFEEGEFESLKRSIETLLRQVPAFGNFAAAGNHLIEELRKEDENDVDAAAIEAVIEDYADYGADPKAPTWDVRVFAPVAVAATITDMKGNAPITDKHGRPIEVALEPAVISSSMAKVGMLYQEEAPEIETPYFAGVRNHGLIVNLAAPDQISTLYSIDHKRPDLDEHFEERVENFSKFLAQIIEGSLPRV